jgi:hypothetical protein
MKQTFIPQPKAYNQSRLPLWLIKAQSNHKFWDGSLLIETDPPGDQDQPDNQGQPEDQSGNQDQPEGQPDSQPEDQSQPDKKGLSMEDMLAALSTLIAKNNQEPQGDQDSQGDQGNQGDQDDQEPQSDQSVLETKVDPKQEQMEGALRNILIQQAKVPEALVSLLPKDIGQLGEFLGSPEYTKLANALKAPEPTPKPGSEQPDDEPPTDKDKSKVTPKTFGEITPDMMREFDKLMF